MPQDSAKRKRHTAGLDDSDGESCEEQSEEALSQAPSEFDREEENEVDIKKRRLRVKSTPLGTAYTLRPLLKKQRPKSEDINTI